MKSYPEKIHSFLRQRDIAVTGVSSTQPDAANHIFNKFRNAGYAVYAINPKVSEVENSKSYPNLTAIGKKVDGVVIASPPRSARAIVEECIRLGITKVWFHSSVNQGSLDEDAAAFAEKNDMEVIRTGCPLMYIKPVDFPHKCIRFVLNLTGKVPKK